jgi:ribosomal protein L11 methyltransferase
LSSWFEITVRVPVAAADDIATAIAEELGFASAGTQIRADSVVFWVPVEDSEQALGDTRALVASLRDRGFAVDPARVEARPAVPEEQWRDAWKKYFRTIRLTRQIVVVPSWDVHDVAGDDLVISMDPGQAFGTGDHATTRLMLEEMQALRDQGYVPDRVLDAGTGSGVLAVAAIRLWPECRVEAVDIDPLSISATQDNCERNAIGDRVRVSDTPIADIEGRFDLVLANIQAGVLTQLAEAIAARATERGYLVLSGLLSSQARGVGQTYVRQLPAHTLRIRKSDHDPEWSVAVLSAS